MFIIGFGIFCTYMFFLVRMINNQHKIQERQLGKTKKPKQIKVKKNKLVIK